MTMTAEQLARLRGQSVEGSFYLAECGHCGEMYPSNKLTGGEPLFSGDYGECFCPLCGADDTDITDNGAWGSEAVTAWNYQQKRVEALLDELERKDKRIAELEARTVTVKLPQPIRATALGRDFSALQYSETVKLLRDAGINLTVEGGGMIAANYTAHLYCDCDECTGKQWGSPDFAEYVGNSWAQCVKEARADGWIVSADRVRCFAPGHKISRNKP